MKRLGLILIAVALCVSLITSCAPQNEIDEVVDMKFDVSKLETRTLNQSVEAFNSNNIYWMYEATKIDGTGYTTGATNGKTKLVEGTTGTSAKLTLSAGKWEFKLYGYKDSGYSQLAYEGETQANVSGDSTTVSIFVKTLQSTDGKGELVISNAVLNSVKDASIELTISLVLDEGKGNNTQLWEKNTADKYDDVSFNVKSGRHHGTIKVTAKDGTIVYANEGIDFDIYDNLTTTIGGLLDGKTTQVEITTSSEGVSKIKQKVTLSKDGSKLETEASPVEVGNKDAKTTITIPSGSVDDAENVDFSLVVYPAEVASSSEKFTAESGNSVVAGLDITLKSGENEITSFKDKEIQVETFIAKGLSDVKVVYAGEALDSKKYNYDSTSGKLTFNTNHLSEYYVTSSSVAINTSSMSAYRNLQEALNSVDNDDTTILLLSNLIVDSTMYYNVEKKALLDLCGHTLSGAVRILTVCGGNLTIDNGTIDCSVSNVDSSALMVGNYSTDNSKNKKKAELTIGKNLLVKSTAYGIGAFNYKLDSNSEVIATLNVYGKINSFHPCVSNFGSQYNGTTINIYEGSELTQYGNVLDRQVGQSFYDVVAIYHPGPGTLNIYGGTIISKIGTALEVRDGEVNIYGGTFKSEAESFIEAIENGSGPTTIGAALAIVQHNTDGSHGRHITVTIDGNVTLDAKQPLYMGYPKANTEEAIQRVKLIDKNNIIPENSINGAVCKATKEGSKETRYYLSLQAAINDDFSNGGGCKLLDDITLNVPVYAGEELKELKPLISITKDIRIDLNNKSIKLTGFQDGYICIFSVMEKANVIIQGEGLIDCSRSSTSYSFNIYEGNLTINGDVNITGAPSAVQVKTGKLTINGGKYSLIDYIYEVCSKEELGDLYPYLINCIDKNFSDGSATIEIKGGSFADFNPCASKGEPENPTSFVPDGYTVTSENVDGKTWYTVTKSN